MTLACDDGQLMEAHKVILASSTPLFQNILQKSKHPHPLIYLRGFQSKDFVSILDFLYFGEANVYQEDLDSFLAIAEVIQLTGQTSTDLVEEREKVIQRRNDESKQHKTRQLNQEPEANAPNTKSTTVAVASEISADLQALDEKVKSMMEKGQKMIPDGGKQYRAGVAAERLLCILG